ncbi:MAG: ribosome biogenesis GTPase YlqF [Bacteriovoracaceae bacterium]|jgi:ribosome biogenesis GTPase A|nr:ribosome biogenesis GTPase YlqF [Bacteriovoracaceae bacterium]
MVKKYKTKKTQRVDQTLTSMLTKDEPKKINWFPGHMAKATKQISEKIKKVDLIIEVVDARAPLISSNQELAKLLNNKPTLTVINKSDLVSESDKKSWSDYFKKSGKHFVYLDTIAKSNKKLLLEKSYDVLNQHHKSSNPDSERSKDMKLMIIGMPNTGKSSLINMLVSKKAAAVANKPGKTRAQQWIKIDEQSFLLDTPGIMQAKINNEKDGLTLAVIYAITDHIVPKDEIVLFILKAFKKDIITSFYDICSYSDYYEAIENIARKRGHLSKNNSINYERTYDLIINDFRSNKYGSVCFEKPPR